MRTSRRSHRWLLVATAAIALVVAACGSDGSTDDPDTEPTETESDDATAEDSDDATAEDSDDADPEAEDGEAAASDGPITVYSGRNEDFVGFIFDDFEAATGIEVEVRYGDTAELAATIVEEGPASPADVYFAQDAGALGALQAEGLLTELPDDVLSWVEPTFRSREGEWTGTTGRVRVLAYNTDNVDAAELPDSVLELTEPEWEGRVGWAPTNGSFQAFVTALRQTEGEDVAREWLEGMIANGAVEYPNNTGIVEGISRGEVDVGITNHYYLYRFLEEDPDFPVANHYLPGDIGGLVNIAGVGVLDSSDSKDAAFELVRYLLSEEVQTYFGQNADTIEFPVIAGVAAPELPSLEEIDPPDVDLSDLEDLQGTLQLLQDVGALS
ncbi:MAG: iron ABC transporter substrate-binding protein [Nitriliruptoraceae bacterium]